MKTLTLEATSNGAVMAFGTGGALAEVGNLADFFKRHESGDILIQNIKRPDLDEVFKEWLKRCAESVVI